MANGRERQRAEKVIGLIARAVRGGELPSVSQIAEDRPDPFHILVSTLISLRTKDEVTMASSRRLLAIASTPDELSRLGISRIEKAIYPAGFYKTKARTLKEISRRIEREYGGVVPDSVDELLKLKGVGRKTATLVVSLGYGVDAICVDVHVHRVSNRIGLIDTKTPDESERALMDLLPRKHWIGYNELLVSFGQQVCTPVSPHCSKCGISAMCEQNGVERSR